MEKEIAKIEIELSERDITVEEFRKRIGIARSTWTRWKSGRNAPSVTTWFEVLAEVELIKKDKAA